MCVRGKTELERQRGSRIKERYIVRDGYILDS